jgi:hypothetical protein
MSNLHLTDGKKMKDEFHNISADSAIQLGGFFYFPQHLKGKNCKHNDFTA